MDMKDEIADNKAPETENTEVLVEKEPESQVAAAKPAKSEGEDLKSAVEKLNRQLEEERQARIEAERRANQASTEVYRAKNEVEDSNFRLVVNAIGTIEGQNQQLKAQYAQAMSSQDFDRAADIQLAMSANAAKLQQLHNGKEAMESRPKQAAPAPQAVHGNATEAAIARYGIKGRSADWVRNHPDWVGSESKFRQIASAHNIAEAKGIVPDSDAYFEEVEKILGISGKRPAIEAPREDDEDAEVMLSSAAKPTSQRTPPPAAPVSRTPSSGGSSPKTVRLSKAEQEAAEASGLSLEEYARNKFALQREGRMVTTH